MEENNNTKTTEEGELEKLKKQSDEYLNGWKRAKADYLNLKKEMEAQNKEIKGWLSKVFLAPLLDIMDGFEKAFGSVPANLKTEVWIEGVGGIKKQFEDFLKTQGVEEMKVIGEKFDPLKHEAIESVDGDEPGRVIEEARKGYLINGEVLRPAKVKVYK
ncbi:MAG: nucleotide exchange factor GrpE [Patescibacteria group bacterium]